jgi:hypothetical protein
MNIIAMNFIMRFVILKLEMLQKIILWVVNLCSVKEFSLIRSLHFKLCV